MLTVLTLSILGATIDAPPSAQDERPRLPMVTDAAVWALTDLVLLPSDARPYQRYVWIPPWGDARWIGAMSFAVNTSASQATSLLLPEVLAGGWLLRWDLRRLAPQPDQLQKLVSTWDSLAQIEPYFHVPNYNLVGDKKDKPPVPVAAPYLSGGQVAAMAQANFSPSLMYRADWLLVKLLSTVDGGKYYEFAQVEDATQEKLFADFGLDEAKAKQMNGDQRALVLRSMVTGKMRRVDRYQGLVGRSNTGSIWITRDTRDGDRDPRTSVLYNLLAFNDAAREVIVERQNGLHLFALFDDKGQLVRSVPDDVARDHEIPSPHTARLQPAIGCIRCHGKHDGLQPVMNDLPKIASVADIIADQSGNNQFEAIDRIAGLYAGDFDKRLAMGRDDYDAACSRVSLGMGATEVSAVVSEIYASWAFQDVTPAMACREVGLDVPDGQDAGETLRAALVPEGRTDPVLAALKAGLTVTRTDWDRAFVDAMTQRLAKREPPSVARNVTNTENAVAKVPKRPPVRSLEDIYREIGQEVPKR